VRLHPDGDRLALLANHTLYLWDVTANRPLRVIDRPGHFSAVTAVAQHAGARLIASGGAKGSVLFWGRDGTFRASLLGHSGPVAALAFSPDGTGLASASADGTVILWRPDGKKVWAYRDEKPGTHFRCLAFHPRASVLAAGTGDGRLLLLDSRRGDLLATRQPDGSAVQALAFLRGGQQLASGSEAGSVHLWQADGWGLRRSWETGSSVTALALVRDGDLLVTGGQAIRFWEPATARLVWGLGVPRRPVRGLALDGDGRELAVADQGNQVLLFNLSDLNQQLEKLGLGVAELPSCSR
jgi:WD40 repeat protein